MVAALHGVCALPAAGRGLKMGRDASSTRGDTAIPWPLQTDPHTQL